MILAQLAIAFTAGWFYYMVAMVLTVYDGGMSLIFQPVVGALFSAAAVLLCLIVGLPIRFASRVHAYWRRAWWLPFVLGVIGFALMAVSWLPRFRQTVYDPVVEREVQTFQPSLVLSGYLLSVFAALHCWLPVARYLRREPADDSTKA